MFVAASTVAIVAIAAAVIVVALLALYVLPRGGRRKRPPRSWTANGDAESGFRRCGGFTAPGAASRAEVSS